jgi:hypothetical protein
MIRANVDTFSGSVTMNSVILSLWPLFYENNLAAFLLSFQAVTNKMKIVCFFC